MPLTPERAVQILDDLGIQDGDGLRTTALAFATRPVEEQMFRLFVNSQEASSDRKSLRHTLDTISSKVDDIESKVKWWTLLPTGGAATVLAAIYWILGMPWPPIDKP